MASIHDYSSAALDDPAYQKHLAEEDAFYETDEPFAVQEARHHAHLAACDRAHRIEVSKSAAAARKKPTARRARSASRARAQHNQSHGSSAKSGDDGSGDPDPDPDPEPVPETIEYQDARYRIESKHVHRTRKRLCATALTLVPAPKSATQNFVSQPTPPHNIDLQWKNDGVISIMGVPKPLMTPLTPSAPLGSPSAPLLIGFDAEWQAHGGTRRILSVQMSCRCRDGIERAWILWHPGRARFKLATLLAWFLSDLAPYIGYKDFAPNDDLPIYHATLAGHYAIVDFTVAYDKSKLLRKTDSLRRTLASVEKPLYQTVWSEDRHRCRPVVLSLRDTMLLAPAGSSVEKLGDALSFPKITLPPGHDKSEMGRLRREAPAAFVCYAARDAEITRRWIEMMVGSNVRVPVTLGGQAAVLLRDAIMAARGWSQVEFDFHWRGLATTAETFVESQTGTMRRRKVTVPRPESALLLTAANHAYYGGRNEGFLYGIHHSQAGWSDFDLAGAYPTAMCLIGDPDYSAAPTVLTGRLGREILKPNSWCFGHVRFRFPPGTMYPCLPVKDPYGRGLIYPLQGETWASAPELWLALKAGCEIELTQPAFLLPTTGHYSLRDGVRGLVQARAETEALYGRKSAQAQAAKERANSAYGKLAQGLAGKRAFSTRHATTRAIPPSPITSAPQAAATTGLVRAVVSAAMMQLHERGYRIASVTTDGFLTDAPAEVLTALDLYGLRQGFADARRDLVGSDTIWELKHRARTLVMLRTRGGFGIGQIDEHALPSAGAGYKVTGAVQERVERVGKPVALAELFLKRAGRIGFGFHALPSPRDYVLRDADGVGTEISKEISWEWDYKREPVPGDEHMESVMIDETRYEHVSYATRPWTDTAAFSNARAATDGLTDPVKTESDVAEVRKRITRRPAAKEAKVRIRGNLARAEAVTVLRGLRSGLLKAAWFDPEKVTGREVCERVGGVFGVELGRDDWKNAGRPDRTRKTLFVGLARELAALDIVTGAEAAA